METLASDIRARAQDLGFNFVDFANLDQTPHFNNFRVWLEQDQFGQLNFLKRGDVIAARKDPGQLMSNAQSMIVLGVFYGLPENKGNQTPHRFGKIAAYAQYEDYHAIIKSKARELMDSINSQRGKKINYKVFIDSGPVMEKDFAFRAGLGWIGKNSLFVHPALGTFTFLCCIVIDGKIENSTNLSKDLCGECRLCIEACPMHCIAGNNTINASRCISYLTIEHRGLIIRDLRSQMGDWVFGCDTCQDICPRNQIQPIDRLENMFGMKRALENKIDLKKEFELTEISYRDKYGKTPIQRLSFEHFQRNLITAAGNSHNKMFIDVIKNFLSSDSETLRATAAWALGEIKGDEISFLLQMQAKVENSSIVREEILDALSRVT